MKNKLILGLGSNLGNRYAFIYLAVKQIEKQFATAGRLSRLYKSPPWGVTNQPSFLNAAFEIETELNLETCFLYVKNIEKELGRKHVQRWGPRCIDIDILFFDNEVLELENVTVPHKSIAERAFVLAPLVDIAPNHVHPKLNKTMVELLADVENDCSLF